MADPDDVTGRTAGAMRAARPDVDAIKLDDARARAERALFRASKDARIGRFVLGGPIGAGGMGVVYRAYDPELDREVALKLIHARAGDDRTARDRLVAEARALARLQHPNVVPVHDVMIVDQRVVIVMELVEGRTLAAWQRDAPPGWRARVATYVAAGRGLVAAHAAGLVHRDFKPANVMVGDDLRVRVLDFGLARLPLGHHAPGAAAPDPTQLTATGEFVGTLAYAAPEQLAGEAATAASDQFSFCVALYEAVAGVRPFAGDDASTLQAAIDAGRIEAPADGRRVPPWLRGLLVRGLAADPGARHPSLASLLAQLDRERGWRRWRWAIAAAMVITSSAIAAVALAWAPRAADPMATCDGDDAGLDAAWSPAQRAKVYGALDAAGPYARSVAARVLADLDGYRRDWQAMQRDACRAHRAGAESTELFDRRVVCLAGRRAALATAADVLAQVDAAGAVHATEVSAGLPLIAACGDVVALTADSPPPPPALRERVMDLRDRLARAEALERAGRTTEARDTADRVLSETRTLDYPPLVIEAASILGRILMFREELAAAEAPLALAQTTALEHHLLAPAIVAGARLLFLARDRASLAELGRTIDVLEPLSRSLPGDHFARPLLLNNIGAVRLTHGDRVGARRAFEAARAELAGVAASALELGFVDLNLALVTDDPEARAALARSAWEHQRDRLGAEHPAALEALDQYAHSVADLELARALLDDECAAYARMHPDLLVLRGRCAYDRASLAAPAEAAASYDAVVEIAHGTDVPELRSWGALARANAAMGRGDAAAAAAGFAAVIAAWPGDSTEAGLHRSLAHLGAGQALRALGRRAEAAVHLATAVDGFAAITAVVDNNLHTWRLAQARASLAQVRNETAPRRTAVP